MARILNRAYAALNRVLDLAGSQIVADVNLREAFAVHDLTRAVEAGVSVPWTFIYEEVFVGAGSSNVSLRPRVPGDWTRIYRGDQIVTEGVRGDHQFFVTEASALASANAITRMGITRRVASPAFATFEQLLAIWDLGNFTGTNFVLTQQNEPAIQVPLPWVSLEDDKRPDTFGGFLAPSGAATLALAMTGFSAPPGVFPLVR